MKLSFSAISTYKNCPLSYKFMYVDKLPTKRTPVLSFGTSLHAALEKFYAVTVPKPPSLEELLGHLTQTWEKAGYSSEAEEQQYFEHAKQVLTNFYHSNASQFQIPAAVEQRFEVELDGHVLRGIIDRLDKLPAGGYEIIDYKTGRNIPPKYRVDSDLQLSIYYLASKELWGIEPEKLTLYFLIPDQRISTTRNETDARRTRNIIGSVAENISKDGANGTFKARENPLCPWCDFQNRCPLFKHKFLKEEAEGGITGEDIKKVADEYAGLKRDGVKIQSRLSELKEIIHNYCEEHKLTRLFTENTIISRGRRVQPQYNSERLKEILEPLGLWEQVIKVDEVCLRKILESELMAEEIKQAVETAKEVENITYALYVHENRNSN